LTRRVPEVWQGVEKGFHALLMWLAAA